MSRRVGPIGCRRRVSFADANIALQLHLSTEPIPSLTPQQPPTKVSPKPMSESKAIVGGYGEARTDWVSIYVVSALSFVGSVQFSLYFAALWPYMLKIDKDITEDFFGLTVALYSLGQTISAPGFGIWSNRLKSVRTPLTAGLCLMFIGNVIYLLMEGVTVPRRYMLLIGRFINGMGSGNVALLRTYASTASNSHDRSRAIAFVTCGQAVGMTLGPAFQFIFTPFDYPGPSVFGWVHFNLYTLPAYLACLMNILGVISLYTIFKESYAGIIEDDSTGTGSEEQSDKVSIASSTFVPKYDMIAVLVCYAARFMDMFVRTNLETLGSAFAMVMFNMESDSAVKFVSFIQSLVGGITLVVYLLYILLKLERYINFRLSCIVSFGLMFAFHLASYAWPFLPDYVHRFDPATDSVNTTDLSKNGGCNVQKFDWCFDLTAVNFWLYASAYVLLIGVSFPLLTVTLNTLFSKILGPRRQGTQQGLFQAASSVARMAGPLAASGLYSRYGPRPVWIMEMAVIGIVMATWGIFWRRMVELKIPREQTRLSLVFTNAGLQQTEEKQKQIERV